MQYRLFGGSGFPCSEIGLGTWQLGADWGRISEDEARAILSAAWEGGVTFYDTADVYGLGRSEELIGDFFASKPDMPFIATKLGRLPEPGWPENFTYEAMRGFTEASIRRLKVEALDLTQLHCLPTEELRKGEVFEHLRRLRQEGLIKAFGASVETVEEGLICLEEEGLSSLQVIFNIYRRKPAEELLAKALAKKVAIIARVPLASGLLSGKFTAQSTFAPDDHRNYNRDGAAFNVGETFAGLPFAKGVELADKLAELIPPEPALSIQALRWILDHEAVTTVIPGASSVAQARANMAASEFEPLTEELHEALEAFYEAEVKAHIRGPY